MQEQERKPLVLKEILVGLDNLYDPAGFTIFTVTMEVIANYLGQIIWLNNKLPLWIVLLNEKSGASVQAAKTSYEIMDNQIYDVAIILEMMIKGGLNLDYIADKDLQKAQSGQIKKLLAMKILGNFPPPFECEKIPLAANWPLTYAIRSFSVGFKNSDIDTIRSGDFYLELEKKLEGLGVRLIARLLTNTFKTIYVTVEFLTDADEDKIHQVRTCLADFFSSKGIKACFPDLVI